MSMDDTATPTSATDFDAAMRTLAQQLNVPVPRLGGVPLSPSADQPVIVYSDRTKPAGFDYVSTFASPIPHSHEGLITEILYSCLGMSVADSRDPDTGKVRKGTFSFWATPWAPEGGPTRDASPIAVRESQRLGRSRNEPYRGMNPLVFDTPRTLDATIEALRGNSDPLGRVASRILTFGRSLTYSPNIVVLTRLADLRYYIPASLPKNALSTWTDAFQIARASAADDVMAVWDRLISTNQENPEATKVSDMLFKASQKALFFASVASGPSAIKANSQCEAASSALSMLEIIEPALRDRSLANGDMLSARILGVSTSDLDIEMTSSTLRFKKGDRVSVRLDTGGTRSVDAAINSVVVSYSDTIHLNLIPAYLKKRTSGGKVVGHEQAWTRGELMEMNHGQNNRAGVILTKTLMSPYANNLERQRWMKNTQRDRVKRSMPLEVAVAAAGR